MVSTSVSSDVQRNPVYLANQLCWYSNWLLGDHSLGRLVVVGSMQVGSCSIATVVVSSEAVVKTTVVTLGRVLLQHRTLLKVLAAE